MKTFLEAMKKCLGDEEIWAAKVVPFLPAESDREG